MGAEAKPLKLGESLTSLLQILVHEQTVSSSLAKIVEIALHMIDGADMGGVALGTEVGLSTVGSSDDLVRLLDEAQAELQEGPCIGPSGDRRMFLIADTASDETWPRFSRRAAALGIHSVASFVLEQGDQTRGVLNLYGRRANAFLPTDVATGMVFAAHAATALANAETQDRDREEISQLEEALRSRDVIGMAKGILMEREGCTAEEAFDMLRVASQQLNRRLREIGAEVVEQAQMDSQHAR